MLFSRVKDERERKGEEKARKGEKEREREEEREREKFSKLLSRNSVKIERISSNFSLQTFSKTSIPLKINFQTFFFGDKNFVMKFRRVTKLRHSNPKQAPTSTSKHQQAPAQQQKLHEFFILNFLLSVVVDSIYDFIDFD